MNNSKNTLQKIDYENEPLKYIKSIVDKKMRKLVPKKLTELDLEDHLSFQNNLISSSIIISGLIKNIARENILLNIQPKNMGSKSFHRYIMELIIEQLKINNCISLEEITLRIHNYTIIYYGEPENKGSMRANYYNWAQILKMRPTEDQVLRAIEIIHNYVKERRIT